MMTALTIFGWVMLSLAVITLTYLLASRYLPLIVVGKDRRDIIPTRMAYLHGNGVHIDFIFAREDVPKHLLDRLPISTDTKYVAFGWGDYGFYLETPTWEELSPYVAFRAFFLSSPTLMHVINYPEVDEVWRQLPLNEQEMESLLRYVEAGFYVNPTTSTFVELPGTGYWEHDFFFRANGTYLFAHTCNTWVNNGLKGAGIKTGIWSSNEPGVMRHFPERAQRGLVNQVTRLPENTPMSRSETGVIT
ncbi:MAG: DUF2459 domain-containing protein [Bacteroidota bacterium]